MCKASFRTSAPAAFTIHDSKGSAGLEKGNPLGRNLIAMASNLKAMASNLRAMASYLRAMASNLRAMASYLGVKASKPEAVLHSDSLYS